MEKQQGFVYIEMVDLVANALMSLLDAKKTGEILYSQLDAYGARAVEVLGKNGIPNVYLLMSRERQNAIFEDYSDYFEPFIKGVNKGIKLRKDITSRDLWKKFCTSMSLNVIKAFEEKTMKEVLGIVA